MLAGLILVIYKKYQGNLDHLFLKELLKMYKNIAFLGYFKKILLISNILGILRKVKLRPIFNKIMNEIYYLY